MAEREGKPPMSDPPTAPQGHSRPSLGQQQSRVSKASSRHGTTSGRTSTLRSQLSQPKQQAGSKWGRVKNALKKGTLVAVGLEQSGADKLHWHAVQKSIQAENLHSLTPSSTPQPRIQRLRSRISYHEVPAAHVAPYPYQRQPSTTSLIKSGMSLPQPGRSSSETTSAQYVDGDVLVPSQQSLYGTGRIQAVRTELKPDLWKVAYMGVRRLASQSSVVAKKSVSNEGVVTTTTAAMSSDRLTSVPVFKSFIDLDEEDEVDVGEEQEGEGVMETDGVPNKYHFVGTIEEDDEDFFGAEIQPSLKHIEGTDAAIARISPRSVIAEITPEPKPKLAPRRRGRIGLPHVIHDPLFGGYDRGYGGLGLPSRLLRFKYKKVSHDVQKRLDEHLLHKRPYFTYWLMLVHTIIMITAVSVYGFAPYGWDQKVERGTVLGSNLALDTMEKIIIPSVWGGPSQQSLVLLGALYGPCMRRDRQLFEAIDYDRENERNQSGCCVRLDESGCVQGPDEQNCKSSLTEFVYTYTDGGDVIRGVCGTSPRICSDPRPGLNPDLWQEDNILTWPICLESNVSEASDNLHLTCEITGRPCCVGIQALCNITTREHCDFVDGRFHQEAFLCSQVDCLNTTCGLLPFREFNEPDQVYRLWIALFLHAGLIHLFFSLIFSFLILRHVEKRMGWLRTAILYIVSGIGGNLVSAFFVPYNPEVGPASSILGVVAYMFVFLIFESRLLVHAWVEFIKLGMVVLFFFILGLFPFIDNFAHVGGFVFGFILSGILVPYHSLDNLGVEFGKKKEGSKDVFRIVKWAMVIAGIPAILLLFALFFVLFYVVQDTWDGFRYFNCIPFTDTICQDLSGNIRIRDSHII